MWYESPSQDWDMQRDPALSGNTLNLAIKLFNVGAMHIS